MESTPAAPNGHAQAPPAPDVGVPTARYSNRELRDAERHGHWHDRMAGMWSLPSPDASSPDYRIETRRRAFSGLMLISGSYPEMKMVRDHDAIRKDPFDHYMVSMHAGQLKVDAEDARRAKQRWEPMLSDMSRPSTFAWDRG
jgi:hypothetical protein